ncbi:MAG: competence type IV pilus major pilin ComGC [Pirellulaceae bacterium]
MHSTLKLPAFPSRPGKRPHAVRRRGFSLLELLAVVIILGIMAAVIIPRIGGHTGKAKANVCSQYQGDLNSALEKYYFDQGTWATDLNDIQTDVYYPTAIPVCPVNGQAYTIDPTTHRLDGHSH